MLILLWTGVIWGNSLDLSLGVLIFKLRSEL